MQSTKHSKPSLQAKTNEIVLRLGQDHTYQFFLEYFEIVQSLALDGDECRFIFSRPIEWVPPSNTTLDDEMLFRHFEIDPEKVFTSPHKRRNYIKCYIKARFQISKILCNEIHKMCNDVGLMVYWVGGDERRSFSSSVLPTEYLLHIYYIVFGFARSNVRKQAALIQSKKILVSPLTLILNVY